MKNILVLTKAEQRAVIVIVMALLAATFAARLLEERSQIPAATSTSGSSPSLRSPPETEADRDSSPR